QAVEVGDVHRHFRALRKLQRRVDRVVSGGQRTKLWANPYRASLDHAWPWVKRGKYAADRPADQLERRVRPGHARIEAVWLAPRIPTHTRFPDILERADVGFRG
ncbi:MAG: hypothetical protein O6944_07055, partial [Gammaproteobacteria bacterium]|nr:hypothetical protein [Gammaproteobacteria bacterium]